MTDARRLAERTSPTDLGRLLEASCPPELIAPERGYWIYGAGGFGRQIARELIRLKRPVLGFVDRKARDLGTIDGLSCIHPDNFTPEEANGAHYVHGVLSYATAPQPILDWAEDQPFDALIFPANFYELEGFALESYWLNAPSQTMACLPDVQAFYDVLADDDSRETLVQLLQYRLSSDPRLHPITREEHIYVERFLPIFDVPITFIDAGAFTGDSFEALASCGVRFKEWLAFEPDPENAVELRRTAARHRTDLLSFTLVPAGLSNVNDRLSFGTSGGMAARLVGPGETGETIHVDILRFDDNFRRSGPIYVKMDIEGAEHAALLGMRDLLAEHRPVLAVSIYHRTTDLWELPKLIRTIYPHSDLRLRQHCHHGFDTVLYVSPR